MPTRWGCQRPPIDGIMVPVKKIMALVGATTLALTLSGPLVSQNGLDWAGQESDGFDWALPFGLSLDAGTMRPAGLDWAASRAGFDWAASRAGFDWAASRAGFDWAAPATDGFDWAAPSATGSSALGNA